MSNPHKETIETAESLAYVFRAAGLPNPDPGEFGATAATLRKAARVLLTEAVKKCNGVERYKPELGRVVNEWTEDDERRSEARIDATRARVNAALVRVFGADLSGLEVEFQGDPHGAMVKLWRKGERDKGSPLAAF